MDVEVLKNELAEMEPEMLFADGFEDALIGTVQIFSKTVALYDREKCIKILIKRDGMDPEGAEEYFDFNVTGAYVGDHTPAFATIVKNPARRAPAKKNKGKKGAKRA